MTQVNVSKAGMSIKALFLAVVLLLVMAGFPRPTEALTETKLSGYVTDVSGLPIANSYIDVSNGLG